MPRGGPSHRRPPSRSRSPVSVTIRAPTSGTAATRSPVNELDSFVSARASSTQGIATSIAVYASSGRQRGTSGRSSARYAAIGASSSAAIAVRKKTSVTGASSRTATRIIRYGMPQITHIAAKSTAPRRLTRALLLSGRVLSGRAPRRALAAGSLLQRRRQDGRHDGDGDAVKQQQAVSLHARSMPDRVVRLLADGPPAEPGRAHRRLREPPAAGGGARGGAACAYGAGRGRRRRARDRPSPFARQAARA